MNDVAAPFPDRELHVVLDNLNIHKNQVALRWLERHPRVHFHHTPTHASWLNLAECFFGILSKGGLSQSVYHSQHDLREFLLKYIEKHNEDPWPFNMDQGPGEAAKNH